MRCRATSRRIWRGVGARFAKQGDKIPGGLGLRCRLNLDDFFLGHAADVILHVFWYDAPFQTVRLSGVTILVFRVAELFGNP